MNTKRLFGLLLFATPMLLLFIGIGIQHGAIEALKCAGIIIGVLACSVIGVHLMESKP